MMVSRLGVRLVLLLAMACTIGCDRVTKHVASTTLAGAPGRSFFADTLRLEYAENTGAFLGLGAAWPPHVRLTVFALAALVGLALIVRIGRRLRHVPPALVGLALIAAGTLSNLADRIAYGSVVDFLNVGIGALRTGIFNVADVAIFGGAALVVAFGRRAGAASAQPDAPA
jgi:signal peptidase II